LKKDCLFSIADFRFVCVASGGVGASERFGVKLFGAVAVSLALSAALAAADWRVALPGYEYRWPEDLRAHLEFQTEWWYFVGNLEAEGGEAFGYQLTFFRQGVIPPGEREERQSQLVPEEFSFAHFALSELDAGKHHAFQRASRGAFGEAGFADGDRLAWIRDWKVSFSDGEFRLRAEQDGVFIDLELEPLKGPVYHGENGVSQKAEGAGRASHYHSLTRIRTSGTIGIDGRTYSVTGSSWFDQEWATNQLAANQVGWDWFSLQFEDGTELMLYQMRTDDGGRDPYSSGTFVREDGSSIYLGAEAYTLTPLAHWTSPSTGGRYPVKWEVEVKPLGMKFIAEARQEAQEMEFQPIAYWEGPVTVAGTKGGEPLSGRGYLEMTGYAAPLEQIRD